MGRLEGKVAIITGGNMGIGAAASRLFAEEGASVALAARRVEEGEAIAAEIRDKGGKAIFVRTDVSKSEDCKNLVDRTLAEFGKLDIAFNNAGVEQVGTPLVDLSEEEFDHTIAVNLKGVFLCMKHQLPHMIAGGGGSIVNTSSLATIVTKPGLSGYGASKFGVIGLTRFAAVEYAAQNIRVNALVPGATRTEMFSRWLDIPGVEEEILSGQPNGRFAEPIELAKAALYLASDDASFVNGHAMVVDGAAALP